MKGTAQRITQHKMFVPCGTHPNFFFAKSSFMLKLVVRNYSIEEKNEN